MKVTGRDGKQYAATRPQPKPASKPATPKSPAPLPAEWTEFLAKLATVSEFVATITPANIPETAQSWQLVNTLESAARSILSAATRLRTNPR